MNRLYENEPDMQALAEMMNNIEPGSGSDILTDTVNAKQSPLDNSDAFSTNPTDTMSLIDHIWLNISEAIAHVSTHAVSDLFNTPLF